MLLLITSDSDLKRTAYPFIKRAGVFANCGIADLTPAFLYDRGVLGQTGMGHWSPIAAYDAESDSFLILDVAKFKYPPVRADASTVIAAMRTADKEFSRGFLIIEEEGDVAEK